MASIRTHSIVPVDLNAFMCINARILASFYEIAGMQSLLVASKNPFTLTGDITKSLSYQRNYENMKLAMKTLHWHERDGIWYDWDLDLKVSCEVKLLIQDQYSEAL